jgi:hypothetical protein
MSLRLHDYSFALIQIHERGSRGRLGVPCFLLNGARHTRSSRHYLRIPPLAPCHHRFRTEMLTMRPERSPFSWSYPISKGLFKKGGYRPNKFRASNTTVSPRSWGSEPQKLYLSCKSKVVQEPTSLSGREAMSRYELLKFAEANTPHPKACQPSEPRTCAAKGLFCVLRS